MKPEIHPNYTPVNVTCSCGNTFESLRSVPPVLHW